MFGKRKRKPADDDLLVPHGMIWYGTADPAGEGPEQPARQNADAQPVIPPQPAVRSGEVVEMVRRPPASEQFIQEPRAAVNAPLPVIPLSTPARGVTVSSSPQNLKAVPRPISASTTPSPRFTEITAVIDLNEPEPPATPSSLSVGIQRGKTWVSKTGTRTRQIALTACGMVKHRWIAISQSVNWKKEFARGRQYAQTWAQSGAASTQAYSRKTGQVLSTAAREGLAHSNRLAESCKRAFSQAATDLHKRAADWRPGKTRVRVVLSGLPLRIRIFLARQFTRMTLRPENAGIDARLWISMTLAAISALIALAIVSVVPHYAAKYLPSRIPPTPSTVNASGPALANIIIPPASAAPLPALPEGSKAHAKLVSAKKVALRKHRPSVDDDYVAPDTFKYYGDGSRASR